MEPEELRAALQPMEVVPADNDKEENEVEKPPQSDTNKEIKYEGDQEKVKEHKVESKPVSNQAKKKGIICSPYML